MSNDDSIITRGFRGRGRETTETSRLPPGQHLTADFPVLSAGPTPRVNLDRWDFTITGPSETQTVQRWSWAEFQALPQEDITVDIHCVTRWSKFGTRWRGVSLDTLLAATGMSAPFVLAVCDGGYTTNLPLADVTDGKAWVVHRYDDQPLAPEHGGPARLLVPHLYFWKSAKWVRGLELLQEDKSGFWEQLGYHHRGDPWKEERHWND